MAGWGKISVWGLRESQNQQSSPLVPKHFSAVTHLVLCGESQHDAPCSTAMPSGWPLEAASRGCTRPATHSIGSMGPRTPMEVTRNYFQSNWKSCQQTGHNFWLLLWGILGLMDTNEVSCRPSVTKKWPRGLPKRHCDTRGNIMSQLSTWVHNPSHIWTTHLVSSKIWKTDIVYSFLSYMSS